MTIELAKVGEHRNGLILGKADLLQAVSNFKDTRPISIGHIKSGKEPKYGDVKSLSINGDTLVDNISLQKEVEALFDKGYYDKWSSGFKRSGNIGTYFHHLALLGAEPPAIEGLEVIDFSDASLEEWSVESGVDDKTQFLIFSDFNNEETIKMDEELKIFLKGIQDSIESLKEKVIALENGKGEDKKEENPTLEKENEELKKQVKEFSDSMKKTKIESVKKALEGKLPKEKIDLLIETLLKDENSFDFSDKNNKNILDVLSDSLGSLSLMVESGELNFSDEGKRNVNVGSIVNKF